VNQPGVILIASALIASVLAGNAWRKRRSGGTASLSLLLCAIAAWCLFYGLKFFTSDLAALKALTFGTYAGITTVPVLWLVFAARFSGDDRWLTRRAVILLLAMPVISLLLLATNDLHHRFFLSSELSTSGGFAYHDLQSGPFWWIHVAYSYLLIAWGAALLIRAALRTLPAQRTRILYYLAAMVPPFAANLAYLLGAKPYGFLDLTPIAFMASGVILSLGAFSLNLFEVNPFALDVLFNSIPDAILVLDCRSRLINANPAARELIRSRPFGKGSGGVLRVESGPAAEHFLRNSSIEFHHRGRIFSTAVTGMITPSGRHMGTLVVLHDVTERKNAQDELSRLARIQGSIAAMSAEFIGVAPERTDGVVHRALETIGPALGVARVYVSMLRKDGTQVELTHEWCSPDAPRRSRRLHEIPAPERDFWLDRLSSGRCLAFTSLEELPPGTPETLTALMAEGVVSLLVVPMVSDDKLMGYMGFETVAETREWPATERDALRLLGSVIIHAILWSKAELALRSSESLARTVIDNSRIGISVRAPTGQLLLYNKAWKEIWGMSDQRIEEDLRPRERLVFDYRDDYFKEHQQSVYRIFTEGGDFFIPEMQTEKVDPVSGRRRVISQHFSGITGADGAVERIVVLTTDITRQKRAEEERETLWGQLTQAQKMESVGRLAGGVAHDFNNMLGAILGHAELALSQVETGNPMASDLEEIRLAARRSADLTRQLLAFARKQTIAPRVLDLNETVSGVTRMLRRIIGEGIDLLWRPGDGIRPVRMDPSQIDQILTNLCINARDAVGEAGSITIETGAASFDDDHCLSHPGFLPGDYAMISVSDDGCGMDREMMSHLFEPFFTTKETGKGTGLGLATVYGIVQQNHGFIDVWSRPGKGAVFRVYLPCHEAPVESESAALQEHPTESGNETILLVEDEPAILNVTRVILERKGYRVIPAPGPEEAVSLARANHGEISLLITDVVMPGMNGWDLARYLRKAHPGMKCLFMSGYTANVIAHQGVLDEGVNFICKPFAGNELARMVRETLDSRASSGPASG
jgi:PAS domain S-box-containing protein